MATSSCVNRLTELAEPERVWRQLFRSADPFTVPFDGSILFFYTTDGYVLAQEQYEAIKSSAGNEATFYLSVVEIAGEPLARDATYQCEWPSYEEYAALPIYLENALFSPKARWGVLVSHEDHAVMAGDDEFIRTLLSAYPRAVTDVAALERAWANNANNVWVGPMASAVRETLRRFGATSL